MGIDEHQYQQGDKEDDRKRNRDPVEVFLHQARSRGIAIHRTRDDVRQARSLAGMQKHEQNQPDA